MDSYFFDKDFNYRDYAIKEGLPNLLSENKYKEYSKEEKYFLNLDSAVDPKNTIPFKTDYADLARLHYLIRSRKVTTILEFGVGKSTLIFGNALNKNKADFFSFTNKNLRRDNLYECHSVDNYYKWIQDTKKLIPKKLLEGKFINLKFCKVKMGEFQNRVCTYYEKLPNICPDFIYLDGPDQFSPKGSVRGLSTRFKDRMPMAADILSFEHFLQPGTLIVIDGRTANARFLKTNFQRNWYYYHDSNFDQHFFELSEPPLGKYNEKMINHCLGEKYFKRFS